MDRLRLELAGVMEPSGPPGPGNPSNPPAIVLTFTANQNFNVKSYLDQGYTTFDAVSIGAGGGPGGGFDEGFVPYNASLPQRVGNRNYGGRGGGGGVQRVQGKLLPLGDSIPIVVGKGGARGVWGTVAANMTDGADGGYSAFGSSCVASGGKGGKKAGTYVFSLNPGSPANGQGYVYWSGFMANGGDGGIGGSTNAGGGGAGAIGGQTTKADGSGPGPAAVAAVPGAWNPSTQIGSGGGGGSGSFGYWTEDYIFTGGQQVQAPPAFANGGRINGSNGAGGAFNATDSSYYSPGSTPESDLIQTGASGLHTGAGNGLVPGYGGGAKATPLTGLPTTYGDSGTTAPADLRNMPSGQDGVVVVKLTAT